MKLAITGMIGAGKSTAMAELTRLGWLAISADALAGEIAAGAEARDFLQKYFPEAGAEGVQRAVLRERFVADAGFREAWEGFLHPRIRAGWQASMAQCLLANWAVEVPLLYEKGLETRFDKVVVLGCSPSAAIARWVKAGRKQKDYEALSNLLLPWQKKVSCADFVLSNNDSTKNFLDAVRELHERLIKI